MNQYEFSRRAAHAEVLLSQGKYDHAEMILEGLMATGFEEISIVRMMALAKIGQGNFSQAEELCRMLVSQQPDEAYGHYLLAVVRDHYRDFAGAHLHLDEAIRLEPDNSGFFAFKASLFLHRQEYDRALEYADTGLRLDAENTQALNARASALIGLNRKDEAFRTIHKSLETDPENADTHANMGWSLLHLGKSDEALEHFKTSLQLEPGSQFAKNGLLEAMKAKFPVYRYFLMAMLYLSKMTGRNKWAWIIGGYVTYRILVSAAKEYSTLKPFLVPLIGLMALFFISSWIFSPLMNLYLLTNKYGRYSLEAGQKESARLVGISLAVSLISFILFLISGNSGFISTGFVAFGLMIPLGSMNNPDTQNGLKKLRYASAILTVIAIIHGFLAIFGSTFDSAFFYIFIIGLIAYQWFANYVLINE